MKIYPLILSLLFVSCSTVMESMDPYDSTMGYEETTNEKGETVYKRTQLKKSYHIETQPDPVVVTPVVSSIANTSSKKDTETNILKEEVKKDLAPIENSAVEKDEPATNGNILFEVSSGDDYNHFGLAIGMDLEDLPIHLRIGGSIFSSEETVYLGFDTGGRLYIPIKYAQPFVGVGGYIGDNKSCEDETDSFGDTQEVCEKKFLFASFVEYGIKFKHIALFSRNYSISDAGIDIPVSQFFGINIIF